MKATVDPCDLIKVDPKEAREIRAAYIPIKRTRRRLEEFIVVDRVEIQAWKVGNRYEQQLVTYHVDASVDLYPDKPADPQAV